ncbi:hypothetical protein LY474_05590 [Myxococcus stipitatus]|uniref:hypothetical protein n=1 Tax=Myxococcus stipitatus TaxID=83455 RepID=UPI001F288252|nr:hypothetical protein [Myxococcus stipitatus]MCE9667283.1 hypothetical protein [Myxococcus stipitatus]
MGLRQRLRAWKYKLGLGGTCDLCQQTLRRPPTLVELYKRACPDCAERHFAKHGRPGLVETAMSAGFHLMVRGVAYSVVFAHLARFLAVIVALLVSGGVGWLLHAGVTQARLPLPLAVLVGAITLVATLWMLLTPRR